MDMRKVFTSSFFRADDFDSEGRMYTIRIVMMQQINQEWKPVMYFEGQKRALVLNQTNSIAISQFPGFTPESDNWANRRIVLFSYHAMFQNKPQVRIGVRLPDSKSKLAEPDKITGDEPETKRKEELSDPIPF